MVNTGLLQQVSELERTDQIELLDFLHGELDDGDIDTETKAFLDQRLEDIAANPDDLRDADDVLAELRTKWL